VFIMTARLPQRRRDDDYLATLEITGAESVRLIDGLGCKRREQWLISRSTSTAMLLWFIAATNAQERQV